MQSFYEEYSKVHSGNSRAVDANQFVHYLVGTLPDVNPGVRFFPPAGSRTWGCVRQILGAKRVSVLQERYKHQKKIDPDDFKQALSVHVDHQVKTAARGVSC